MVNSAPFSEHRAIEIVIAQHDSYSAQHTKARQRTDVTKQASPNLNKSNRLEQIKRASIIYLVNYLVDQQ